LPLKGLKYVGLRWGHARGWVTSACQSVRQQ